MKTCQLKTFFVQQIRQIVPSRSRGSVAGSGMNAIPTDERRRVVAAARLAILELETNARMEDDSRRYFAKPGEAEWGC
jgi:hypothetical protein